MRDHGAKVVFGKVARRGSKPAKVIRPPTESSEATVLDNTQGTDTANTAVSAPSSSDGDRIYLFLVQNASSETGLVADPSGFTLAVTLGAGGGGVPLNWLYYMDVSGSGPATITLPEGSFAGPTGKFAWQAITVRGGSTYTHSSPLSQNATNDNDPPAVAPSDVPGEYLVITFNGMNQDDDPDPGPTGSTGYTEIAWEDSGSGSFPRSYTQQATKTITVSENPDAYAFPSDGIGNFVTLVTVAIKYTSGSVASPDDIITDHGDLDGLADDDHSHYLNTSRHSAIDAADHGSGAATDGHVLTADGAGGAAWEAGGGGSSDHGALTGLADDDHTQYLLAAGTRAATFLEVSGLTGATGSSPRFVGGTTSGAPASGTFALGDYVVTEDGNIYVCTTAGSPGTWTAVGAAAATDSAAIHDNVAGEIAALTLVSAASGDHVLIEDASDSNNKKRVAASDFLGGGGGGGQSFVTDPNLAIPGTPDANDIEFVDQANGTTVATLGFTWFNQQNMTASVKGGRLACFIPKADTQYGGLAVAPPSGDWTLTTRHRAITNEGNHSIGLMANNDSPAGTYTSYRYHTRGLYGNNRMFSTINSSWAAVSNQAAFGYDHINQIPFYERFVWDNTATTLSWQVSADPLAGWSTLYTTGAIATPTFVGLSLCGENSANRDLPASFDFFRFNWTPDFDASTDD